MRSIRAALRCLTASVSYPAETGDNKTLCCSIRYILFRWTIHYETQPFSTASLHLQVDGDIPASEKKR